MSEDATSAADSVSTSVRRAEPERLEPVRGSGWRGYARWSCPALGCDFSLLQNPRKPPVKPEVERHIREEHGA